MQINPLYERTSKSTKTLFPSKQALFVYNSFCIFGKKKIECAHPMHWKMYSNDFGREPTVITFHSDITNNFYSTANYQKLLRLWKFRTIRFLGTRTPCLFGYLRRNTLIKTSAVYIVLPTCRQK